MSTSTAEAATVLRPFRESRQSRRAFLARTRSLLAALKSNDDATLLALPEVAVREDDGGRPVTSATYIIRSLSDEERATLLDPRHCNCRLLGEGANVRIMHRVVGNGEKSLDASPWLKAQVWNNCFGGRVILGVSLDGPDETKKSGGPCNLSRLVGVTNNGLVRNSVVEPGASVHKNAEVSDSHAMERAAIVGCGTVSCSESDVANGMKKCNFDMAGGTMDVKVGPKAGERVVTVKVESTLVDVCHDLKMDSNGGTVAPLAMFDEEDDDEGHSDVEFRSAPMNVLCPHSSVLHTSQTSHVHLLPHAAIRSATSVTSALLLPHAAIENGCDVSHALLQWDAGITSQSDARRVFLMERSSVGPHSFTDDTIYGPDAHASGGEVHLTLFGPTFNSSHQSFLMSVLWPLGRGVVGYGSNLGTNHTGRVSDQEASIGEGTFTGLGCDVKYPIDLASAPYSIIAAGVQLPPQRIALPFSLITGGPAGMNQLTPGWVLHYSPYTVVRNEAKFAKKRTARRHDFYTGFKILRPGIVDMLVRSRDRLAYVGAQQRRAGNGTNSMKSVVYETDRTVPGLGANRLTEKGRQIGIRAYTDAIQRYALRGLLDRLVGLSKGPKKLSMDEVLRHVGLDGIRGEQLEAAGVIPPKLVVEWPVLPWNESAHADAEALWKHQRSTLLKELPSILREGDGSNDNGLARLLRKCVTLEEDHAERVYKSKSRDDVRGADTIPGYKDVRVPAEEDSVVLAARKEADRVRNEAQLVEQALGTGTTSISRL